MVESGRVRGNGRIRAITEKLSGRVSEEGSSHGDKEKWEEKRDLVCFKCKKPGHIKYDCPLYKSESKRRMKKGNDGHLE